MNGNNLLLLLFIILLSWSGTVEDSRKGELAPDGETGPGQMKEAIFASEWKKVV